MPLASPSSPTPRFLLWSVLLGCLGVLPASGQVINEFVGNHTGSDNFEYLELFGSPSTDYSNLTLVQLDGDAGNDDSEAGRVESIHPVGSTDADGIWWTGYLTDRFDHNSSFVILLVEGWSGNEGDDLDATNDGVLDSTPWTSLLDSVAVQDEGGDPDYGAQTTLVDMFDGEPFSPGGASRIPNGTDTDSVGDWRRNDWDGAGLPGHVGSLTPPEVANTPGFDNDEIVSPDQEPMIHEFVLDHTGSDTHEFIEIWGAAAADYSLSTVVALDETGVVVATHTLGQTDASGFWSTGFLNDTLPDDTLSLLLVEEWTGAALQDLDTNDDGTLDLTPWTELYDSVAVSHGPAELTYSSTTLETGFDGLVGAVGGASRFPNFTDTDAATDWVRNDFDGAGLDGFVGDLEVDEAENSIERVNVPHVQTFYRTVVLGSAKELRDSLHATIDDHLRFPYSAGTTDTWDILESADEDPNQSNSILTVYRNSSETKQGGGNSFYNREHSWPKSLGFPDEPGSVPYTDTHHLMLSDIGYNSARGSRAFGTCTAACNEYATDVNNGHGGVGGPYPADSNWQGGPDGGTGTWEVWNHRRGDVARAQFYMDVRYEGGAHTFNGFLEPDLELTDDTSLIQGTGTNTSGTAYLGRLAVLLEWHQADPPDDEERQRNEVIYRYQGNRNPFVDHPEWVDCIFEGICGLFSDGFETGDTTAWN